jgi:transcriptional regulator with XRE-family HTH domain
VTSHLRSLAPEARSRWEALGRRLRSFRVSRGLSQRQVARELGVQRLAVTLVEGGKQRVDALQLADLARVYETTPDDLLGFVGG